MTKSKGISLNSRSCTILLVALLPVLLTACHPARLVSNDPSNECDHPVKPSQPYTDLDVSFFIIDQAKAIDVCRALLGNEPRMK